MEEAKYNLAYATDSYVSRAIGAVAFWGFLALLVWLSAGSVWWTFLFGTIAVLALWVRAKMIVDKYHRRFNTKAELLAFVQGLPEDAE